MKNIGDRIGAIQSADSKTVYAFGFGTYQGEEIPPDDVPGPFGRLGLLGIPNPKLVMDDGTVVWGCESWWGDVVKVTRMIGERKVEFVKPQRTPATDEEREELAQIKQDAAKRADAMVDEIKETLAREGNDAKT